MIKVAIIGATGYSGEELLKILVEHPQVKVTYLSAKIDSPKKIEQIFPQLCGKINLICEQADFSKKLPDCDLVFLALPHRISMEIVPQLLQAGKKVIDLSADYRLRDAAIYEQWYDTKHKNPEYIAQAVYGLPEVYRQQVKQAKLVANPGCYPTAIILSCLPLLKKRIAESQDIIVDAKTGTSGAGREKEAALLPQIKDNFFAYKVNTHQHAPEVNQELSRISGQKIEITFTPHLIPVRRGILSTIYLKLKNEISQSEVHQLYQDSYQGEPFIKVLQEEKFPQLKSVIRTNFCHIGLKVDVPKRTAIVISAIDNLVKGASGQAVQNMNIMYGFKETEGLK